MNDKAKKHIERALFQLELARDELPYGPALQKFHLDKAGEFLDRLLDGYDCDDELGTTTEEEEE